MNRFARYAENRIEQESQIVWRIELEDIRFVRVEFQEFAYRKGLSDADRELIEENSDLIGCADLEDNAPLEYTKSMGGDDYYYCDRRIFVLRHGDLNNYPNNCPAEAVDPLTVEPKVFGDRNDKAKGDL